MQKSEYTLLVLLSRNVIDAIKCRDKVAANAKFANTDKSKSCLKAIYNNILAKLLFGVRRPEWPSLQFTFLSSVK